ncbi:hypothetical protein A5886_000077 [Enterococcus sp. 8G7_MSG3316]|uniref:DUF1700 domain-containing protein n=1 Tax=Candidatus Enterococcus testudinis TaxID=1834191 RepID=A0A242A349_9ENTE|nr:DUF1700 domain-containing protein [Enterococcus sp. 8G7_MSG3316]OTN75033.1 hypothetical protein A5886_000077 [Enterococcus sp. 8G7_MSG3316]
MERVQFIKELAAELSYKTKPSEIHQLIDYYDEMIDDLIEEGLSEEEAVTRLGNPKDLIKALQTEEEIVVEIPRRFHPLLYVILILGFPLWGSLLLAAILLMLSVLLVLWCGPLTTGLMGIATLLGGIASVVLSPLLTADGLFLLFSQLGAGLFLFGFGLLCLLATYRMSHLFSRLSMACLLWPKQLLTNYRKKGI